MAYTPINFKNKQSGGTPVSAANLNHMEDGIKQAHDLVPTESGSVGQVLTKTSTGTSWQDADNLPEGGTEGQVLTKTANDGAEWTDAGNPTDTQVAEAVGDWLEENITTTSPLVDTSLSITGAAADAKKTGDEISSLKSAISDIEDEIEGGVGGLDLSDLSMTAVQSQTEGFSTLTLSDGETSKSVDIPVASLDPTDIALITNIVEDYLDDLVNGDEVSY